MIEGDAEAAVGVDQHDRQGPDYDADFYAWTQEQASRLREAGRRRVNAAVDWENVAEEIESSGRSQLDSVESYIVLIIEHLLKLEHSPASPARNGWRISARTHRRSAARILRKNPSLVRKIRDSFPESYDDAREAAADGLAEDGVAEQDLPPACPYTLEEVLERGWFPKNRHGLE